MAPFKTGAHTPDGKQFVYSTNKGLYLRSVDELTVKLIPGTEDNPQQPFFSPDGKWIGYFSVSDRKLKKIAINGGAPVVLCDVNDVLNASWGADDSIVYGETGKGIMRISANGGAPELLVKPSGLWLVNPQILPDGKTVLFGIIRDANSMSIAVQSPKSVQPKVLIEGGNGRYLPTGHLVYAVKNSLFAIPIDLGKLEIAGGPVPLIEGVFRQGGNLTPQYAVSNSGTLVYIQGTADAVASAQGTLVWVDRKGKEVPIAAAPNNYASPRISPDGTKVALDVSSDTKSDIWALDLVRETMTRLTFDEASNFPLWTPDGKRIVYRSTHEGGYFGGLYWKAADGTGDVEKLGSSLDRVIVPCSWSRDGKTLALMEATPSPLYGNIGMMSMEGDHARKPLLQEKHNDVEPRISPDGRWVAYASNESGKYEVYVRPFPEVNKGRWQVSTSGGNNPLWSPDGRELFYRSGDAAIAVSVRTAPTFSLEGPNVMFRGTYVSAFFGPSFSNRSWDISPDGKRFLMIKPLASTGAAPTAARPRKINVVVNWLEELKQRVPVK